MSIKKVIFSLLFLFVLMPVFSEHAYAGNYSYYLATQGSSYGRRDFSDASSFLMGFNETHGFSMGLKCTTSRTYQSGDGGRYLYYVNFSLPDDGSTWRVQGYVSLYVGYEGSEDYTYSYSYMPVDTTINTPGTFTGVSIGQAMNAANSAKNSADIASVRALNAYNAVNDVNGNTITAVRDENGSVLTAARQSNTKLDTLQTTITNIQNNIGNDTTPPTLRLRTVSGAVATSGGSISALLDISDNTGSVFTYSFDGVSYIPVPANNIISIPLNFVGPNAIQVWAKDEAGNTGKASITIRRL